MVNKSFCDRCNSEVTDKKILFANTGYFRFGEREILDKTFCDNCIIELETTIRLFLLK